MDCGPYPYSAWSLSGWHPPFHHLQHGDEHPGGLHYSALLCYQGWLTDALQWLQCFWHCYSSDTQWVPTPTCLILTSPGGGGGGDTGGSQSSQEEGVVSCQGQDPGWGHSLGTVSHHQHTSAGVGLCGSMRAMQPRTTLQLSSASLSGSSSLHSTWWRTYFPTTSTYPSGRSCSHRNANSVEKNQSLAHVLDACQKALVLGRYSTRLNVLEFIFGHRCHEIKWTAQYPQHNRICSHQTGLRRSLKFFITYVYHNLYHFTVCIWIHCTDDPQYRAKLHQRLSADLLPMSLYSIYIRSYFLIIYHAISPVPVQMVWISHHY